LKRLKPIASKRNIELVLESYRPVTAECDEVKLTLALSNLVENAIKYNVAGGWVQVTLDADHKFFYVTVDDSGIGIPEEYQDKIFERFYRVDKARSRETGGTGLGLSITKNIIQMHHGAIKVASKEDEGTTFSVRIPLTYMAALLLMIMILVSGGCQNIRHLSVSQSEKDDADTGTGYNIYYINNDETKIKAFAYQLSSTTEDGIISECMEALAVSPDDKNYKAVIASSVKVQQYQYDKDSRTLTLYFSQEYEQLSRTSEMLVRTAIVKTMTQFGGIIDYVSFNVDGSWLTDSNGNTLRMKNSDYVSEVSGSQGHVKEARFCLYFAAKDGSGLVRTYQTIHYPETESMAEVIVRTLMQGYPSDKYKPVVSQDALLKSVSVNDGLCQVDFSKEFLNKIDGQDFRLNVYGVVNSLTELSDIQRVRITVDGKLIGEEPDGVVLMNEMTAKPDLVVQ